MLERRSGTDRRSGLDRRRLAPDGAAARIVAFLDEERLVNGDRRRGERRSGLDRRAPEPALVRMRRR
jgi:hypothetical protein